MAANKKPRKAYKPKACRTPINIRHGHDSERELQLIPHAELMKLKTGHGDEFSWNTLACRLNVGLTLADRMKHAEAKGVMTAGLDAVVAIRERHTRSQAWGISGDEARAIGEALVLTDDIQLISTRRELLAATTHVFKHAAIY